MALKHARRIGITAARIMVHFPLSLNSSVALLRSQWVDTHPAALIAPPRHVVASNRLARHVDRLPHDAWRHHLTLLRLHAGDEQELAVDVAEVNGGDTSKEHEKERSK